MQPTVLILTAGQLSRNPRVYKEAAALAGAGFDVTVVRVANVAEYEAYDRDLTRDAPFRNVVINHLGGTRGERLRAFRDRAATALARKLCPRGVEWPYAFGPYLSLLEHARRFRADLTVVHTEAPFCVGVKLLRSGRRVAADFEDWHSEDLLPGSRRSRPLALLRRVERRLLREATVCTTTSQALADALAQYAEAPPPRVVRNSFPLQPRPLPRSAHGQPSLFWFSQTIGPGRGLEAFLAGWKRLSAPPRLVLLGSSAPGYREALRASVPPEARPRLSFLEPVHPQQLPSTIALHDVGLALEHRTPPSRDLTITNKIFQYANAGLAILATPTAGQREFLDAAPGAGALIDLESPARLADDLNSVLNDIPRLASMGLRARQAMEASLSWEIEQRSLCAALRAGVGA